MNNDREIEINAILVQCGEAEIHGEYEKLVELSDRVFELDSKNSIAFGFKSFAYLKLKQFDKSFKLLDEACKLYPDNYYLKNNLAMYYYDLREYEKSLECCEEGLKIKEYSWLCENKVKALIKLDRLSEAIEFYETAPVYRDIGEILLECGKYAEAVEYCLDICADDRFKFIDKVKDSLNGDDCFQLGGYYLEWIYRILHVNDVRTCPDCGGELIEIVWGFPSDDLLEKAMREEIFLGGCVIPGNPCNYHCKSCGHEFDLGHKGLDIEPSGLNDYIKYKIDELVSRLKIGLFIVIKSLDNLRDELKGFDDAEFSAFVSHLKKINFIREPKRGYVKLSGFDEGKCMKEYLDEGKFAAPRWLVYPQLSAGTILWRMGGGENYAMNMPRPTEEFRILFPKPKNWLSYCRKREYKVIPPLGEMWEDDGKPKYSNMEGEVKVNDFITLNMEGEFQSDTFRFSSIEHAISLSRELFFEKCDERNIEDAKDLWEVFKYSVCLNAAYYKIMNDECLKRRLLETGDRTLVYVADDEWGGSENLFGRALMELRDEIRRLCKNEDLIDWAYTEYLKYKPWR